MRGGKESLFAHASHFPGFSGNSIFSEAMKGRLANFVCTQAI